VVNNKPIAVLDTGAGGLSVVAMLRALAPYEEIAYFADYAHLPYGLKSPELIKKLALAAASTVVKKSGCKVLVVACHTISVWCLDDIASLVGVPVLGMLEPSIEGLKHFIAAHHPSSLGIISTKATVSSGAYLNSWPMIDPLNTTRLVEHACGPLVGLIEESVVSEDDLAVIVEHLLPSSIRQADAVMIGCTHFSAIKNTLIQVIKPGSCIIDAANFVSVELIKRLRQSGQLTDRLNPAPLRCYVSDNPSRFINVAKRFIQEDMSVEWLRDSE